MMIAILNRLNRNATSLFAGMQALVVIFGVLVISFPRVEVPPFIYYWAISGLVAQSLALVGWLIFFHHKNFMQSVAALILGVDLISWFTGFYPLSAGSMLFMAGPAFCLTGISLFLNREAFTRLNYLAGFLLIGSNLAYGLAGFIPDFIVLTLSQVLVYSLLSASLYWGRKFITDLEQRNQELETKLRKTEKEKEHYKKSLYILQQGSEELNKHIKKRELEIQNILTISEQVQIGKDSKDILRSFLLTALGQMGSSHAFIMAREKKNQNFWGIIVEKGLRSIKTGPIRIYLDSNLITILRAFRDPLYLKDLPRDSLFADELQFLKQFEKDVVCPIYIKNRIIGIVVFGPKVTGTEYTAEEFNLISVVANQSAFILEQVQQSDEYRDQFSRTVRAMLYAMEAKFAFNKGHLIRTANYVSVTAKRLGFPINEIKQLGLGTLMHDIGKTAIDDRYLLYDKSLTNSIKDEKIKERILTHTIEGGKILKAAGYNELMVDMAVHHHEYYNGKGYPHRIGGEEIPIETRMLAVCNAYDAMTSERPYRKSLSEIQAMEVLRQQSGQQFDPEVVNAFLDIVKHVTPKPAKH